jgi:hypothetical protein
MGSSISLIASAGIAVFVAIVAPLFLILVTNHQRRTDREAEWAHQEKVAKAEALAEARTLGLTIVGNGDMTAAEVRAQISKSRSDKLKAVSDKVDVVHTFVNSEQTAGLQRDLDAAVDRAAMLRQNYSLLERLGEEPNPKALGIITAADERVRTLQAEVAERHRVMELVERQIEQRPDGGVDKP